MIDPLRPTEPKSDLFAESDSATAQPVTQMIAPPASTAVDRFGALRPGQRVQDFVILRQLGRGSFARVYLAQQVSLDRQVALKVSDKPTIGEAVTLAGLEHDHIVKVYSEFVEPQAMKHCLCLQYVPGTTLAYVIHLLYQRGIPKSGSEIVAAIDELGSGEIGFDPAAAHDRETLVQHSFAEAVCRLGEQLAEALAFAHARGILHCDVKPANILMNRYGRPLLADFNVSLVHQADGKQHIGGTLDYMAPEQLAVFAGLAQPGQRVDQRADIYSLGVVLFELATGRIPFVRAEVPGSASARARQWIEQRGAFPENSNIPKPLERIIRRCLHPDPAQRYQDGVALAQSLHGARDILVAENQLPQSGRITRFADRYPFRTLFALTFLPHLIGSAVNIAYNAAAIRLTDAQQTAFGWLVIGYNAIVYPLCLYMAYRVVKSAYIGWNALYSPGGITNEQLDAERAHVLRIADWGIVLACLGWLPGALVFPLGLDLIEGGITAGIYAHFAVSFALSGLIALIYSHFGIQFVVLRVFYPRLRNPESAPAQVRVELRRAGRHFDLFQCLAALVPLVGAVLLIIAADERLTISVRLLVTGLIVVGMIGVGVAVLVRYRLNSIIQTLATGRSESAFPCVPSAK